MEYVTLDIKKILLILKKHLKLIISITLIITAITAYINYYAITPMYTSDIKLFIGKSELNSDKYNIYDIEAYQKLMKTYSELITTSDLVDKALNNTKSDYDPDDVLSRLNVSIKNDTQVLNISYTCDDRNKSKEVLDEIVDEFEKESKELIPYIKISVLEHSKVPDHPSSPRKTGNTLIAFMASLFIGSGVSFLKEFFCSTISTKEQIEQITGIPVIAMVPVCKCK